MSTLDQYLRRPLYDELTSAEPRRRAAAAQELISRLDLSLDQADRASQLEEKEDQLKHSSPLGASDHEALSPSLLTSLLSQVTSDAQVALLSALKGLPLEQLELIERHGACISWALRAPTPKVRQGAARLLSLRPVLPLAELREALWAEEVYFVRASIILAVGRHADPEALSTLKGWAAASPHHGAPLGAQEREALTKAQSALNQGAYVPDPHPPLTLELSRSQALLWCAPLGLEGPLIDELSALGWREVRTLSGPREEPLRCSGLVIASPPAELEGAQASEQAPLERPRCSEGLGLLLASREGRSDEPQARRVEALLALAEQGPLQPLYSPSFAPRYRVALTIKDRATRRSLLRRCRALMGAYCPGAVESPSDYQAQLVARFGDRDSLVLRLDALSRRRGFVRSADVGASMSHPVAASVARLSQASRAKQGSPAGEPYVVLDPTCGSGTLLIERALLSSWAEGSAQHTWLGQDLSRVAIKASQENQLTLSAQQPELAAQLRFHKVDSARATWPLFDEALMNLPFGLRVTGSRGRRASKGELERLYFELFERATERAKPHATLTCYSARRALLGEAAQAAGWRELSADRLWSGGLLVHVLCYHKR